VDAARDRVLAAYRRAGFSDARVTTRPEITPESQQVVLVFEIEEGPRQVLQEVLVQGNRGIDADVVTRALGVKIGDPLGPDAWLEARTRIFETGLFRRVDLTVEPVETAETDLTTKPMRIQVTCRSLAGRHGFAVEGAEAEVSGRNLVPGPADVTRRTLFGRATRRRAVSTSAAGSSDEDSSMLHVHEPAIESSHRGAFA
jgi:outer membrane translocation and assembly module TamA